MLGWILLFFLMAVTAAGVGVTTIDQLTAAVAGGSCGTFAALALVGVAIALIRNH